MAKLGNFLQRKPKNSGYSEYGASSTRRNFRGMTGISGAPKEDINENLLKLRQRSRLLYMSSPLAASAVKNNRTAIVGTGLTLKAAPLYRELGWTAEQAEQWAENVENEFALWADGARSCDMLGLNNFYELQQLAVVSWLCSGDVFCLMDYVEPDAMHPYGLRLRLTEADLCRTPTDTMYQTTTTARLANGNMCYDGVEVDSRGRVIAYHLCDTYPFEWSTDGIPKWTRVLAYDDRTGLPNILHIMDAERPGQYRGVPYLANVIETVLQLTRYTESEVTAAVVQSYFTAFIKTTDTSGDIGISPFNRTKEPPQAKVRDPKDYEMGPGNVIILQDGDEPVFADPTHPSGSFGEFISAFAELIGAALEVPSSLLLKKFTSNYTAARGELMEAWKAFKMRREWLIADFCQPVYERFMWEAISRGRINAPGFFTNPRLRYAYLRANWVGPSQGQLDPVKEVNAAVTAISNGLSTGAAESIRINGSEYTENLQELAAEKALQGQLGLHLQGETASEESAQTVD